MMRAEETMRGDLVYKESYGRTKQIKTEGYMI